MLHFDFNTYFTYDWKNSNTKSFQLLYIYYFLFLMLTRLYVYAYKHIFTYSLLYNDTLLFN